MTECCKECGRKLPGKPRRFIVEGTWSGYTNAQSRVVHREVLSIRWKPEYEAISAIRFSDGTCLHIEVRDAKPREKIQQILGYKDLLSRAARQNLSGWVNVNDVKIP